MVGRQEGASAREVALKLGKMIALGLCQTLHIYFLINEVVACFSVINRKRTKIGTLPVEMVLVCPYDVPTTSRGHELVVLLWELINPRTCAGSHPLLRNNRGVNGAIPTNLSLRVSRSSCFF